MKKPAKKPVRKVKTSVKSRAAVKSRASVAKKVAAKKTVKRKGVVHHAKRLYRLTPKFIHGAVVGAFVGIMLVTSLGVHGSAAANPPAASCISTPGGFSVNKVNANVDVKLDTLGCGTRTFVLKAYYAPDAHAGKPQWLLKTTDPVVVKPTDKYATHMNVFFDTSCYFQVDLVDITNPQTPDGYPIPRAVTGGTHDCRPDMTHSYACSALDVAQGDGRTASISTFSVFTHQATFTGADISWGDGATVSTPNVLGASHAYAADGTYTVSVTPHFTYVNNFQKTVSVTAPACSKTVTYTPIPPESKKIQICEIETKRSLIVDEKLYPSTQYPADKYTTDMSKCVVTPPLPPVTPTVATASTPSTLANTGPGAVLVILALAMVGGTLFHKGHKHIQRRRAGHRA
jgi:hypothetical protein